MKLKKQKQSLVTSLLLASTILTGCVNTANSNNEKEPLQTTQLASVNSNNQKNTHLAETKNKTIQDIESQIKSLKNTIETLNADNARLLQQSEQYQQISSESEANSLAADKLQIQVERLKEQLGQLKESNSADTSSLKEAILDLEENIKQLNQVVNNKEQLSQANKNNILELTNTVDGLSKLIDETNSDIKSYQNTSSNEHATDIKSLWMSLIALLVLTLGLLIGFMLFRKTTKAELSATKQNLDSECNKIDMKLTELLESQVETMDLLQPRSTAEQEHSIPLKVLTEIHRMKNRLAAMPQDTKGLKPLGKAVGRIEENLKEKGYEMIDLFGEKFIDGMTVNQEFIFDENLSLDEKIISKVVKPQINFNGTLIQLSDVIVSIGE
jgi:DNA repair exonuclease SbcCD ATPase subunit